MEGRAQQFVAVSVWESKGLSRVWARVTGEGDGVSDPSPLGQGVGIVQDPEKEQKYLQRTAKAKAHPGASEPLAGCVET